LTQPVLVHTRSGKNLFWFWYDLWKKKYMVGFWYTRTRTGLFWSVPGKLYGVSGNPGQTRIILVWSVPEQEKTCSG